MMVSTDFIKKPDFLQRNQLSYCEGFQRFCKMLLFFATEPERKVFSFRPHKGQRGIFATEPNQIACGHSTLKDGVC
jgi:hypothetical protein